jgi:hypothetical protein
MGMREISIHGWDILRENLLEVEEVRLWNLISTPKENQAKICLPQTIRSPIEALYAHLYLFLRSAHDPITAGKLPHLAASIPFIYST